MAVKVSLHFAEASRLSAEMLTRVDVGTVVDLRKWFECHPKAPTIIEERPMMVRNPPRARVQIKSGVEAAFLHRTIKFCETVSSIYGPVAAAGSFAVFENLHVIAGITQFQRGSHASDAGAQN